LSEIGKIALGEIAKGLSSRRDKGPKNWEREEDIGG
jgi:hypothetical protein